MFCCRWLRLLQLEGSMSKNSSLLSTTTVRITTKTTCTDVGRWRSGAHAAVGTKMVTHNGVQWNPGTSVEVD